VWTEEVYRRWEVQQGQKKKEIRHALRLGAVAGMNIARLGKVLLKDKETVSTLFYGAVDPIHKM
jgi:hypothetical protein